MSWITRVLLFIFLVGGSAQGQVMDHDFGSIFYWDTNAEADVVDYGVYRADADCADPVPSPPNCPGFVEVASVAQGPDPIQWTELGPVVFVTQNYVYRVTARNTSGKESIFSDSLTIRWLNPNAPGKPGPPRTTTQIVIIINGDEDIITANFYSAERLE